MKDWFNKYKGTIARTMITVVLSIIVTLGTVYTIFCWHYKVDPATITRHFEIRAASIVGPGATAEDGTQVKGFTIYDVDNGTEYLITDYWSPIALVDKPVSIPES